VNDILRRYARLQVPRYTSYPTAAEFAPAVASADQRRWLRGDVLAGLAAGSPDASSELITLTLLVGVVLLIARALRLGAVIETSTRRR